MSEAWFSSCMFGSGNVRREDLFELMMRHRPLDKGDGSKERHAYIEWLGIYHAMRELPSADRPQEWIPCSERMPKGTDGISECEMVLMTLSVGYVACGWINGDTAYVLINNPTYDQIVIADSKEVIAWMPLPKPWKGADDETY